MVVTEGVEDIVSFYLSVPEYDFRKIYFGERKNADLDMAKGADLVMANDADLVMANDVDLDMAKGADLVMANEFDLDMAKGVRVLGKRSYGNVLGGKEEGFLIFEELGLPYPPGIALSPQLVPLILDAMDNDR